MFSKQHEPVLADLSTDLSDESDWKVGVLRRFDFPLNVTTLAVEPIAGVLAAGTANGVIYIFGGPSVESRITLPEPVGIRLLQFSISTYNIVCLDDNDRLHIYDLLEFGKPKFVTSARFDQINSITLSPSHTHVFLATQNGDIKTYDLTCLRKSPYSMPNMWRLYEENMAVSGVPSLTLPTPSNAVETVIHPRNLNLMFVVYASGIILTDLTERSTVRAYELVLPPGAPGGAGYGLHDILTHRRMIVTCIAVHPSGHLFAAGYADGSIAFWAVEDDSRPLVVRTLDVVDVNLVDAGLLEAHLDGATKAHAPRYIPEPIFKLSWSGFPNTVDPRGGETALTVLGGLDAGHPPGLTIFLLPAFNPPGPPSDPPAAPDSLHPSFRSAMRQSVMPQKTFFYEARGMVQDYLLIPRSSPHLGGNFDPSAVLLIIDIDETRAVEAYQFPPPGFIQAVQEPPGTEVEKVEEKEVVEENTSLPAGLLSPPPPTPLPKSPRHLKRTPLPIRTPFTLSNGGSGVLGGRLFKLDNDTYDDFIDRKTDNDLFLDLKGGQAFADTLKLNELKLSKYQPRRILMTYNRDLTVRFFDMSAHLLIPTASSPLEHEWPKPLPGLTVQISDLLDDSAFAESLATSIDKISIHSVQVAPEALECAIVLHSGEVLVYRSLPSSIGVSSPRILADTEIKILEHIYFRPGRRLRPFFMLAAGKGPIETCAISDTGFLAVSYMDGSLIVVDMRGPKIILSHGKSKRQNRLSVSVIPSSPTSSEPDVIKSLTWTVGPLQKDPRLRIRLIGAYQSGHAEVYTLVHSGNPVNWSIAGEPTPCKAILDPTRDGVFVLDAKTGAHWRADRTRLAASFKNDSLAVGGSRGTEPHCILVTVGSKGARVTANINGERVGKVEWGNKIGTVQSAQIVEHMSSHALVVQTDRHTALAYSLPHLEHIHTVQLPPTSYLPLTIDESGDFIVWSTDSHPLGRHINQATYGTFFDIRRAYSPPDIDFSCTRGTIPPQPQPVSLGPASLLGSWFSFNQTLSGDQIDELLGGPNRPIPEKVDLDKGKEPEECVGATGTAASLAASAAAVQTNLYNRLTSAMNERGQLLGDLEERFNSLEEGSRNMVAQAKRLATKQTAKSWLGF